VQRSRSFGLRGNDVETPLQFAWLASGWRVAGVGWFANRETCVVDTVVQETLYWNLKLVYPHSFTSVAKTNFFSSFSAGPRKACSTLTGIQQLRKCSKARKRRWTKKWAAEICLRLLQVPEARDFSNRVLTSAKSRTQSFGCHHPATQSLHNNRTPDHRSSN
jgi:hypothetical protein